MGVFSCKILKKAAVIITLFFLVMMVLEPTVVMATSELGETDTGEESEAVVEEEENQAEETAEEHTAETTEEPTESHTEEPTEEAATIDGDVNEESDQIDEAATSNDASSSGSVEQSQETNLMKSSAAESDIPEEEPQEEEYVEVVPELFYRADTASDGKGKWSDWVTDGALAGEIGRTLDAVEIKLENAGSSKIEYQVYTQGSGWSEWANSGATVGTAGSGNKVQAIKMKLSGDVASEYDIYYRVNVDGIGWTNWAKNGDPSGRIYYDQRIIMIKAKLVKKGDTAPAKGVVAWAFHDTESMKTQIIQALNQASSSKSITGFGSYAPSQALKDELQKATQRIINSGYHVGWIMVDIESGKGIAYNPDEQIYSASTVKGPYIASIVDENPSRLRSEEGRIKPVLIYSYDNPYVELVSKYGRDVFKNWCANADTTVKLRSYHEFTAYSAKELAKLWAQMYAFFGSSDTGYTLGTMFSKPEVSPIRKKLANSSTITYSKAGWYSGGERYKAYNAANDAGIVWDASGPYIIVIMTDAPGQLYLLEPIVLGLQKAHNEMVKK